MSNSDWNKQIILSLNNFKSGSACESQFNLCNGDENDNSSNFIKFGCKSLLNSF